MSTIEKMDRLTSEVTDLMGQIIDLWTREVVFTWRWWFGVVFSIIAWVLWLKFHKRESSHRLLTAGFFVMAISISLDAIGVQLGLWSYRYEVFPLIPSYLPYDLALMPVVVMTLIQLKPRFSPFVKGILFGVLTAFVGEPVIVWLEIYKPILWKFYYSVPIYFAIFLIANILANGKGYKELS